MRDEQDIIALFLAHVNTLFDLIFVVDHRSVDATKPILEHMPKSDRFFLYKLNTSCSHQKQVTHILLNKAFSMGADFVFFLDADEFVDVPSRASLEKLLESNNNQVLELKWKNAIPADLFAEKNSLTPESLLHVPTEPGSVGKVIHSRKLFLEKPEYLPSIANHTIQNSIRDSSQNVIPATHVGEIMHLPIRSRNQYTRKLLRSSLGKLSQIDRLSMQSFHYSLPLQIHGKTGLSDGQLISLIAHYSENWNGKELQRHELCAPAFETRSVNSVALDMEVYKSIANLAIADRELPIDRLLASYISTFRFEAPKYASLILDGTEFKQSPDKSASLTDEELAQISVAENERLRLENFSLIQEIQRVQKGAVKLQKEISRSEGERAKLQEEANRLEKRLQEIKKSTAQELKKTIGELQAEIGKRGELLDRKREELAEARALIRMLEGQAADHDTAIGLVVKD